MKKITSERPVSVLPKDLSWFINKFGYFSYTHVHVLLHLLVNQSLQISKSLFFARNSYKFCVDHTMAI